MIVRERGRSQRRVAFPVVRAGSTTTLFIAVAALSPCARGGLAAVAVGHDNAAAVRIEQDLGGVEAQPARRVGRPGHAITVDLPGPHAGHEDVPVVIGAIGEGVESDHARGLRVVLPVEKQQLDPGCMAGEEAEVDTTIDERGAERGGSPRRSMRLQTMSSGACRDVSIQRCHVPAIGGSSNSSDSQNAFRIRWTVIGSRRSLAVNAMLCECSPQSGWPSFTPCQDLSASAINWVRLSRCCSCSTSRSSRRAASRVTKRCTSACLSSSDQSNQVDSSSWQ